MLLCINYIHTSIICEQKLNLSIDYSDGERGRRRRSCRAQRRSFYMFNRQQRIKSLKMVVETSDKNQYSYFYMLNSFLKGKKKFAQLLNATHLLVYIYILRCNSVYCVIKE